MSKDIMMDTTDDKELTNLMWEATVYAHENQTELRELAELLKALKACKLASGKEDVSSVVTSDSPLSTVMSGVHIPSFLAAKVN